MEFYWLIMIISCRSLCAISLCQELYEGKMWFGNLKFGLRVESVGS